VEYGEAKAVGDIGEQRVADRLRVYCVEHPSAAFLSNILVRSGRMTAQLDHVLIDSHGMLIVEVKVRNGRVRGTADEKRWTAVYGGMTKTFQNPLEQLRGQRNTLSKTLRGVSDPIDLDLIQGVVVFVDADIGYLELDSHSKKRVTSVERLASVLRDRATQEGGGLSDAEVLHRCEQLQLLDQSADPSVQASHAEYRGGASLPSTPVVAVPARRPEVTFSGNPHRPGPKAAAENPIPWRSVLRRIARISDKRLTAAIQFAAMCLLLLFIFTGAFGHVLSAVFRSLASGVTTISTAPARAPK